MMGGEPSSDGRREQPDARTDLSSGSSSARSIVDALRITSIASILTILFGIGTNKVVAVVSGAEGLAVIGIYRNLSNIVSAILSFGVPELLVQRISTTEDRDLIRRILGATAAFLLFQTGAILTITLFFANPLSTIVFGRSLGGHYVLEIRLVLVMTIGVIVMQATTAGLNGLARFRDVSRVGVVTSLLTVLTAYPLLLLGSIGLTLVIGLTCFVGAGLGAYYCWRASDLSRSQFRLPRTWAEFRSALPISRWLMIGPILFIGSSLVVQSLVTRHYGLAELGYFNAGWLLETTAMTVLMSSMRSYYLPTLGRLATQHAKNQFAGRTLRILLVLLLLGVSLLILAAPYLLRLLFSTQFAPARDIVIVLAISMLGQVFIWCCGMFVLHKGEYRVYVSLECIWVAARIVGTTVCVTLGYGLIGIAWVEVAAMTMSAVVYALVVHLRYGAAIVNLSNAVFGFLILLLLLAGRVVAESGAVLSETAFGLIVILVAVGAGRQIWKGRDPSISG